MKKWIVVGAVSAVCLGLFLVLNHGFGRNPHEVPFMLLNQPAPPFTLKSLQTGEDVSLSQLKGLPVVLNFWASWCGPCKMEHPHLEKAARDLAGQAHFVGVVFEDTEANAKAYLARYGAGFPQLMDNGGTAVDYGAAGVPETYFIDAQGIIRHKHIGPIHHLQVREQIQKLASAGTAAQAQGSGGAGASAGSHP